MTARLLRLVVAAALAVAAALLCGWAGGWLPPTAAAVLALALAAYPAALGVELLLLRFTWPAASALRPPSAATLVRAWGRELAQGLQVFGWQQPFRAHAEPDHLPPAPAAGVRGVLLVHGYFCNRGFWNRWMGRLRAAGVPFVAVNLEPMFASIDSHGATLQQASDTLREATGRAPLVVAHSMGGLAVRAWLCSAPGDAASEVFTLGTPHSGTWLARWAGSVNGRQMRLGSPWTVALAQRESRCRPRAFTCFYGDCDNVVFPVETACLPGARQVLLRGSPHVHLAQRAEVFDQVLARVRPADVR